jgi:transcriptional regulator with XRE-family HTH domain
MIEPRQIRAARALLNWSQGDLAEASGVAISSIKNVENSITTARKETMDDIQGALEKAGIEFLPGSGVRLRIESITVLKGAEALQLFFDDVYQAMQKNSGGDVMISGVEEKAYDDADRALVERHLERMAALGGVKQKVLCKKGDSNFTVPYAEYRWVDANLFSGTPFYVYGDKLAMLLWQPSLQVILLHYPQLVEAYRKQFLFQWQNAEIPVIKKIANTK